MINCATIKLVDLPQIHFILATSTYLIKGVVDVRHFWSHVAHHIIWGKQLRFFDFAPYLFVLNLIATLYF